MGGARFPTGRDGGSLGYRVWRRGRLAVAAIAGLIATAGACVVQNGTPPEGSSGALDVVLETDMSLPKDFDHVSLQVTQGSKSLLSADTDVRPGALLLPATFEVKSPPDSSPVTIHAVAFRNHVAVVERDAITPIPTDHVGALHLALNYLCLGTAQQDSDGGVSSTCPDALTCVLGECTTPQVPPSAVVTVTPSSGGGGAADASAGAGSGGCFDVATCFASAMPATVDMASCTVTLPSGASAATVNIGLQFPLGGTGICGSGACWVSLTGWTANGSQAVLPMTACKDVASQGATIVVTTACNTQGADMPPCGAWSSVPNAAPQPPMGPMGPVAMSSCMPPGSQSCGQCGTQSRQCDNGVWSPWGACTGEGPCKPGATQACGTGGTQTCGQSCQWGGCTCDSSQLTCGSPGTCAQPADAHTCGSCGNDCTALPHVVASGAGCSSGKCSYTCVAGFGDCRATGTGCSTDLSTPAACGTCANDCTNLPHVNGPTNCGTGHCSFPPSSCAAGYGDCNGDPTDGCETALNEAAHCGTCATTCTTPSPTCDSSNGSPFCSPVCSGTVCGGTCVDVKTSDANCGACGNVCSTPTHGQAACTAGKCAVTCNSGYAACNGACVDTTSDASNCGSCGHACPSGSSCQAGKCTCPGPTSQSCGNCGTQMQVCNDGVATWAACTGQGACAPGSTQACDGNGGLQTCTPACGWSSCACNAGLSMCSNNCVSEQTDVNNCGGCGTVCKVPNATAACSGGSCAVGSCTTGFGDCNGMAVDGCESTLATDVKNCGGCGKACPVQNDTPGCGGGNCTVAACNTGFVDCNGNAMDGCEVNTSADPGNCGGCGKACPALNDVPGCSGGNCTVGTCNAGFTDCNNNAMDGCEVNTGADPGNCSGCGRTCPAFNDVPACGGGMCTVGMCNTGFGDCNGNPQDGCEVSTNTDPGNCGGCGRSCPVQNDTPGCSGGACTVGTCSTGFGDCNGNPQDGCEDNTNADPANCGGCGKSCPVQNDTPGCSGGTCTVGTCNAGFGDCNGNPADGCEDNTGTDPNNCGGCGKACNVGNNTPACSGGTCTVGACNPGFLDCNGDPLDGCEVNTNTNHANCGACGNVCNAASNCVGGTCAEASNLVTNAYQPRGIAVDGTNLYWVDNNGAHTYPYSSAAINSFGVSPTDPNGVVMEQPLVGGAQIMISWDEGAPVDIAVDGDGFVYWTFLDNSGGEVRRAPVVPAGGQPQVAPTRLVVSQGAPTQIALSGNNVYFLDANTIKTVPKTAVQATPTTIPNSSGAQAFAVDGTNVYWTVPGGPMGAGFVYQEGISSSTAQVIAGGQNANPSLINPFGIAVDSHNVYWTDFSTGTGQGQVYQVPIGGGTVTSIASRQDPATVVVDSTSVYWVEIPTSSIMTAPIGGGTATTLATFDSTLAVGSDFTNAAIGLRVDATNVYWSLAGGGDAGPTNGAIMKVLK